MRLAAFTRRFYRPHAEERHVSDASRSMGPPSSFDVLGAVMTDRSCSDKPELLDVVALLADGPVEGLARGQVGTVVEALDNETVLVEFSDDSGRAYAVTPCPRSGLLVLHSEPEAA
jgi:hypothetical protein